MQEWKVSPSCLVLSALIIRAMAKFHNIVCRLLSSTELFIRLDVKNAGGVGGGRWPGGEREKAVGVCQAIHVDGIWEEAADIQKRCFQVLSG